MPYKDILKTEEARNALSRLSKVNAAFHQRYPGVIKMRQPLHTVYGGAQLFSHDTTAKLGRVAERIMDDYAPNPWIFARALQMEHWQQLPTTLGDKDVSPSLKSGNEATWFAATVYDRVRKKLRKEPVEDFRIDFEDGFGVRSDKEEDETAVKAARETAKGMAAKTLPNFIGIRIKDFDTAPKRAIRTLDIYLQELLAKSGGKLPKNFVITQPKVFAPEHVSVLTEVLSLFERRHGLAAGTLKMEIMIELTQSIVNADGTAVWGFIEAAEGRCRGIHFGTYDYTASCDVIANMQTMDNPVCDFAKHIMQVSAMNTGIMLSDGSTNIMPVPVHSPPQNSVQVHENMEAVHAAWRLQFQHVRHSLRSGFYQGWDLHPGQLPVRYAACYAFYLRALNDMVARMKNFISVSAQATLVGNVFDDAATGQGLINFFLKAYNCGAVTKQEIEDIGIRLTDLQGRYFPDIVKHYKPKKK